MLRLRARRKIQATIHYFAHSRESEWMGQGSVVLGLAGEVQPDKLRNVMQGISPDGRSSLLQRWNDNRPLAWDAVITPGKSVSICALCLPPEDSDPIKDAHRETVRRIHTIMQDHGARTKQHGNNNRLHTGNLTIAAFRHEESRWNDPHLHTHMVIVNLTHYNSQWQSLEPDGIFRAALWYDSLYQIELHQALRRRGFDSQLIAGAAQLPVERNITERLSKGRAEILRREKEFPPQNGMNALHWRDYLADRYRPAKKDGILHSITPEETDQIRARLRTAKPNTPSTEKQISQQELVEIISDYLRRRSLFQTNRRMREAILAVWREQPQLDFKRIEKATEIAARRVYKTQTIPHDEMLFNYVANRELDDTQTIRQAAPVLQRQAALDRFRQAVQQVDVVPPVQQGQEQTQAGELLHQSDISSVPLDPAHSTKSTTHPSESEQSSQGHSESPQETDTIRP